MLHCSILIKKEILQRIIYLPIGRRKMKQNRYVTSQNLQVSCKNFTGRKSKIHTPLLRRFGGFTFSFFFVLHHHIVLHLSPFTQGTVFLVSFSRHTPSSPQTTLVYPHSHNSPISTLVYLYPLFSSISVLSTFLAMQFQHFLSTCDHCNLLSCIWKLLYFFFLLILQICSISSTSIPINLYSSRFC